MKLMNEQAKREFQRYMDAFPVPDEIGMSAWCLMFDYGYPFDEWYLDGTSDDEIIAVLLEDFADDAREYE